MPIPNITTLPPELHLKIRSNFTEVDAIPLSLACKKLFAAYACRPLFKYPAKSFWIMITTDDYEKQKKMLAQWDLRLQVLPRLRRWIEKVADRAAEKALQDEDANPMDHLVTWEICVGCACYKIDTDDWDTGWGFEYIMDRSEAFEDWIGPEWMILQQHILAGSFCRDCCREWENHEVSWDVGVCSS